MCLSIRVYIFQSFFMPTVLYCALVLTCYLADLATIKCAYIHCQDMCQKVSFAKTRKQEANLENTLSDKLAEVGVEEVNFSFIKQNLLEDQNEANKNFEPSEPNSAKIWTGENRGQNSSLNSLDATQEGPAPHADVQIEIDY